MSTSAVFPGARLSAGMYESFYLRAVDPREPVGVWIRHTVHKRPGEAPRGSVWFTLFDARGGEPVMQKETHRELAASRGEWIAVGARATMGSGSARGSCGAATWELSFEPEAQELEHLSPHVLYRLPLPRTKLTSPAPAAVFEGTVTVPGREPIELRSWRGMVGHNWGSEHAERWIWLHGIDFQDAPGAWIDVALGRVRLGGRMTPWIASGALALDGSRVRIGGLGAGRVRVCESVRGCTLALPTRSAGTVTARVAVPPGAAAGWRYADPDGGEHDVVNCSISSLELELHTGEAGARTLRSDHGGAYELGMRERDHGIPIAPFSDG